MIKKTCAVLATSLLTTVFINIVSSSVVFAKTDAILTKNLTTGKYFQYDLAALNNDAVNKVIGLPAPLYDEYMGNKLQAFHDDKTGYINEKAVNDAAVLAAIAGTQFVLDTYTAAPPSGTAFTTTDAIQIRVIGSDGKVADGTTTTTTDELTVIDIQ